VVLDGGEGSGGRGKGALTRYQPVGLPVLPSLLWEERTTRTFGWVMVGL